MVENPGDLFKSLLFIILIFVAYGLFWVWHIATSAPKVTRKTLDKWRAETAKRHEESRQAIDKELELLFPGKKEVKEEHIEREEEHVEVGEFISIKMEDDADV